MGQGHPATYDILKREEAWDEYIMYCKGKHATLKYHEFNDEIARQSPQVRV